MTDQSHNVAELLPWQRLCGVCNQLISRPDHHTLVRLVAAQATGEEIFNDEETAWVDVKGSTRGADKHWHIPQ